MRPLILPPAAAFDRSIVIAQADLLEKKNAGIALVSAEVPTESERAALDNATKLENVEVSKKKSTFFRKENAKSVESKLAVVDFSRSKVGVDSE
ncbi:MAG: hypothetical protein U5K38_17060 [Woeseiaceae bacterium]|nr:hypothetical protein [Woeseiaceae bacterium]